MSNSLGTPHDSHPPPGGCRRHPDCFTCPFPDCISYAMGPSVLENKKRYRGRVSGAKKLYKEGVRVEDIAIRLGVNPQQIYKYISELEKGGD